VIPTKFVPVIVKAFPSHIVAEEIAGGRIDTLSIFDKGHSIPDESIGEIRINISLEVASRRNWSNPFSDFVSLDETIIGFETWLLSPQFLFEV